MTDDRPPGNGDHADESDSYDITASDESFEDPETRSDLTVTPSPDPDSQQSNATRTPNTHLNALIGAAVTVLTAFFVPLSPILGGAIAGYLEGTGGDSGLKVGSLAGVIALVPLLVIVPFALLVFVFEPIAAVSILFILTIAVGFLAVYTVGFSALGGVLGVYLYDEFGTNSD